ncbi:mucin-2 isoform X1 [Drosophila tropicalis]|uniref:mucin-2 isoform X1 n=1 Tax=Drosophila tropicalis TaxID=46794 RepID=UPI0035ABE3E9
MKPFDKYQDIEQGGYAKFTGLKTYNKQLKTMIAIGGWNEASSRFSPLVANPERRQQFIKNILKFLRQNHFDGIDLDWEYPAHREGGKSRDRDNYAQFVQELRAEFEREAEKTGRTRLLLTMAVPAGIEYIDKGYDVPKLNKYLDWFNVLTYDFHSSHEPSVNHHAPLYSLEEDSEYNYDAELNIDYSIKYYLKAGADRDKLVLGIPTYGRSYTLINEESTELGAPSEGPGEQGDATREKGYLAYYEICQNLKDDPEWTIVQPNANVMGPYAYRRNQWVGYDDEAIVRKKAEYVVAQGLGGIMFWAIDNDDFRGTCSGKPYPLIEAAKEAMIESLGLGINEVAKSSGPQKPSRSRSRTDNGSTTRNRLNSKPALGSTRRPTSGSSGRRPAATSTTTTTNAPPSTNIRLTEAEGSSLYIGGRASTTPPPPTTPDPGSDFKCEEEGFFQHPRDCKKYYWCLDSGPSGLGIVAHQFTCPSGLYFNPAADSCDFARNVPCKTKKSTTAAPQTSPIPTTTVRTNRVTAAPPAVTRPIYPRTTTTTTSTTTTTTTRPSTIDDETEYEEEADAAVDDADDDDARRQPGKSKDAEEDPQVIKELIDLIRKVGGVEQLEKHLLRNKDGSITLKENSPIGNAGGGATTPSTISKSLYDRVLSRQGTLSSLTRKTSTFKVNSEPTTGTTTTTASPDSSYSKYSSVLRGNSRQGPQNEGIEKLSEFDGFLKERKEYVTINRNRNANKSGSSKTRQDEQDEDVDEEDGEEPNAEAKEEEQETSTRRPYSPPTPSYTSLRRTRPSTVAPADPEEDPDQERKPIKSYSTLGNTRGRTTEKPETPTTLATGTESASSLSTNRYKYFERTRPTKSTTISASSDDTEEDDEEYDEEPQQQQQQQQNVTVLSKQSLTSTTNTRKYASIGRSRTTTTTTATPETTTTRTTTTFTETAKANSSNNVLSNNIIQTAEEAAPPPQPPSTTHHPETLTILNEITEPIESTSITNLTLSTTNQTPTPTPTPTPNVEATTTTIESQTSSIDSLSLTDEIELTTQLPVSLLNSANPTPIPILKITTTTTGTTTTADELATTTTTTATATSTTSNDINDVNNDHIDSDEVTQSPNPNQTKYLTISQRRKNAEAVNDASPNSLSSSSSSNIPNVNSFRTTYSGRRQPQKTQQQSEQEPKLTKTKTKTTTTTTNPDLNLSDVGNRISSPRPFGYPRRRTRPTTTTTPTSTTTQHSTDNDNINEAVENTVKTRLSQVDRSKNRYQLSRTPTSATPPPPPTTTTTATSRTSTTPSRLPYGSRKRVQVTEIIHTQSDDDENDEVEAEQDVDDDNDDYDSDDNSTATTTTSTTTKMPSAPTPRRIRVLKYRRPLQINNSNNITNLNSTTTLNSATNINQDTTTTTTSNTTTTTNNTTTIISPTKRFRKIVRKLRPVEASSEKNNSNDEEKLGETTLNSTTTTTRKPFVPKRSRFNAGQDEDSNDLLSIRNRLKEQQARGEPLDGVINSRLNGQTRDDIAEDAGNSSDLQRLRNKVRIEQARGDGEDGVINDRLKKLLSEKSQNVNTTVDLPSPASPAKRPVFRRKLVAKRPVNSPVQGQSLTTKAPSVIFNTTRPTRKFVRRKNGRFDPFNSSVKNTGEGFVRSDPRGSRLPGTQRFKQQQRPKNGEGEDDDDDEEDGDYDEAEPEEEPPQVVAIKRPFALSKPIKSQQSQSEISKSKAKEEKQESGEEDDDDDDNDGDDDDDADDDEVEETTEAHAKPAYKPKNNRIPPGSRPSYTPTGPGTTGSGNVPYNPRNRQSSSTSSTGSRFGTSGSSSTSSSSSNGSSSTKRPRVINRPPGVATPNLTLRPVANDYERTTPLTPLKPAPFIPSNTRSYERKYTGPSTTETSETANENSLIEDLNIDALNARNKKIFKIHSKKHTTLKPKVVVSQGQDNSLEQGFLTTTPQSAPLQPQPPRSPNTPSTSTQEQQSNNTENTELDSVTETESTDNANASSIPQDDGSWTTPQPPPATTLLHVFTLLDSDGDDSQLKPTRRPSLAANLPTKTTEVEPKHKLIEINRIVEINSKQAKAAQRKSKANQDFGTLRVESLPHVEQLGEISVVKYVHLVDGSAIQINDGHSTVADYTPTEPTVYHSSSSTPVRNSLPQQEEADLDADRSGKSLLPEVLVGALETSTISLEGLFDSARKGKQLSSNQILGEIETTSSSETTSTSTTISNPTTDSSSINNFETTTTATATTTPLANTYLRQTTTANVSRRPVLSVRKRIINTPHSSLSSSSSLASSSATSSSSLTQNAEFTTTTSKYNRLRSRLATTTITPPPAAAAATSANKLKSTEESATLLPAIRHSNNNDIISQHKFQPASFALRRQFQTRRLTTLAPSTIADDSATEVPHTQNPLFKRRLTLTSTISPPRTTTGGTTSETTTNLYANDDDDDQIAKSSIHTSRFNQILSEHGHSREDFDLPSSSSIRPPTSPTKQAPEIGALSQGLRRQLIPRPRRPQSTTQTPATTAASNLDFSSPPLSRRQQSRRRPHKYIEVYSRPPSKPELASATLSRRRSASVDSDYYDNGQQQLTASGQRQQREKNSQPLSDPKVIVHGRGVIECLAQGNFPHPLNCRKFISCAKFEETGGIVGWEYTCPKGLTYDGVDGMCTPWSTSSGVEGGCRA